MTLPFTTIILAHQADNRLKSAIGSTLFADEILIIWQGEIPLALQQWADMYSQIKVLPHYDVISDFAKVRNEAMDQAKNDWVFFLDGDEVLEKNAEKKIKKLIENPKMTAAQIKRIDIFLGKKMQWGEVRNVWITRLMQKGKAKFTRSVHEVVEVQDIVKKSKIRVFHMSHLSISAFLEKIIFYVSLEVKEREKSGEQTSSWQMIVWPTGKFLYNYFWRLGILDGWQGLIYAIMMSIHSFALRACLRTRKEINTTN